ncbi:hypothetical protein EYF80_031050 [Liparis tanakae]|uniref:Uncharacterized protein n=1 Tax=Liparis tanakae TaxID=230148 RepID=A0A4Z2H040_9TELE|nr:hypothetical protein EYF80_031050 [Liparis tanakae]
MSLRVLEAMPVASSTQTPDGRQQLWLRPSAGSEESKFCRDSAVITKSKLEPREKSDSAGQTPRRAGCSS